MFPWENFEMMRLFSIYPSRVDTDAEQHEFDRKFHDQVKAARRRERALGPRLEKWKWQRFIDGDFSGFQKEFDEVILIPIAGVMASIVVLGMFIVQLDYVDEYTYREFMVIALATLGPAVLISRWLAFYAVRIWVVSYGEARIQDAWILNSQGRVEEVAIFDEFENGE